MTLRSLDDIKAEVSIEEVLIECGARFDLARGWGQEVPFFCPFHLNLNTPAASMNPMRGVFNCYSCGAGGSVIDAAMLHRQTDSITEAKQWLEETFLG